jgi:Zn-dependent protease
VPRKRDRAFVVPFDVAADNVSRVIGTRGGSFGGFPQGIVLLILAFVLLQFATGRLGIQNELANPVALIALAIAFVIAVTFHEFMHAYVAERLGDATARLLGRLTLNPLAHLDPLGTVFLVLFRFGWGKPVPVNYSRLQGGRRGGAAVAFAGPATNFVIAAIFALPLRFGAGNVFGPDYELILTYIVYFNVLLGIFNLVPIPPLDGSNILYAFVPSRVAWNWGQFQQIGPFLLLLIFWATPVAGLLLVQVTSRVASFLVGAPL